MTLNEELIIKVAVIAANDLHAWEELVGVLRRHATQLASDCVMSPPDKTAVAQGVARHANAIVDIFANATTNAARIQSGRAKP